MPRWSAAILSETERGLSPTAPRAEDAKELAIAEDYGALAAKICEASQGELWISDAEHSAVRSASRPPSPPLWRPLCLQAALGSEPLIVEDAANDERFSQGPSGGEFRPRFYIGLPLLDSQGYALGVLTAFDLGPKALQPWQVEALDGIAQSAAAWLEELRTRRKLAIERSLDASAGAFPRNLVCVCSYCNSVRGKSGVWRSPDAAFYASYVPVSHGICPDCLDRELELLGLA